MALQVGRPSAPAGQSSAWRLSLLSILVGLALVLALVFAYISQAEATAASPAEIQIQGWVRELQSDGLTTKRQIAQQQLEAAGEAAVPALVTATHSHDPIVRRNATEMLGYIASPRAAAVLVELLRSDPAPDVRRNAAWALGELRDGTYQTVLEQAAQSDKSRAVRQSAHDSLDRLLTEPAPGQPL